VMMLLRMFLCSLLLQLLLPLFLLIPFDSVDAANSDAAGTTDAAAAAAATATASAGDGGCRCCCC
jgi:hypothetical protein